MRGLSGRLMEVEGPDALRSSAKGPERLQSCLEDTVVSRADKCSATPQAFNHPRWKPYQRMRPAT